MPRKTRTLRISSKGQIVIPSDIRRELGLKAGGQLRVRTTSAREIVLTAAEEKVDVEAIRDAFAEWCRKNNRDLVEELHEQRRRDRLEEARRAARYR